MTMWFFSFVLQFDEVLERQLELYLNGGMTDDAFLDWMEKNLDNAARRIISRKDLDLERFEKVWNERAEMRKKFKELPSVTN